MSGALLSLAALFKPAGGGGTLASFVQTTGEKFVTNAGSSPNTITNAFASNVTAGNTVIVFLVCISGQSTGVTVGGTAATKDVEFNSTNSSAYWVSIWRAQNVTGGTRNIVLTGPGTSGIYYKLSAEEWQNVPASALDQIGSAEVFSTASVSVSTAGATTQANEIVYSCGVDTRDFASADSLSGPKTGTTADWTLTANAGDNGAGTNLVLRAGYKLVTSTGTQTATYTLSTAQSESMVIATYKAN